MTNISVIQKLSHPEEALLGRQESLPWGGPRLRRDPGGRTGGFATISRGEKAAGGCDILNLLHNLPCVNPVERSGDPGQRKIIGSVKLNYVYALVRRRRLALTLRR